MSDKKVLLDDLQSDDIVLRVTELCDKLGEYTPEPGPGFFENVRDQLTSGNFSESWYILLALYFGASSLVIAATNMTTLRARVFATPRSLFAVAMFWPVMVPVMIWDWVKQVYRAIKPVKPYDVKMVQDIEHSLAEVVTALGAPEPYGPLKLFSDLTDIQKKVKALRKKGKT